MDFNNFSTKSSCINEIFPNIKLCKYKVFDDIISSWNVTKEKYGSYMLPLSDTAIEHHVLYFHLVKNMCDNKKLTIKNPLYLENNEKEIISSDIYFITHFGDDNDVDLICNYYYTEENIVVGIFTGTGDTGLGVTISYIIYYNSKQILLFPGSNGSHKVIQKCNYLLPKIYDIITHIDIKKINKEPSLIRTIEGYNYGLLHTYCTFVNGIFIQDTIGFKNNIDELIMGPNDPFLIENYYRNKYNKINVIKGKNMNELCNRIYKGVLFKYTHFHSLNKCADFLKSYINKTKPISEIYKTEIEYIKNNFYPIFSINLRCYTCQIKDQDIVFSEVIKKLKKIYPKSYFLIGGFVGDENANLLTENIEFAMCNGRYEHILNEYQKTFESIKKKIIINDYKSLINLKIHNILEFTKIVNFSINTNCGYTVIESMIHNIPSMFFGTKWVDHVKKINYTSKENYTEPIYIEDVNKIKYITDDVYASIVCEITSETIVNILINYDKTNNYILKNNVNMRYIAHRGNLDGPYKDENMPSYLLDAINRGFYVETDLWFIENKLYLGHDSPQYETTIDFLLSIKDKLYCHCKNISALHFIINNYPEIECFYHDKDNCVLTSKNYIWNYPGTELTHLSICVMPERVNQIPKNCFGVCTDYPIRYMHTAF